METKMPVGKHNITIQNDKMLTDEQRVELDERVKIIRKNNVTTCSAIFENCIHIYQIKYNDLYIEYDNFIDCIKDQVGYSKSQAYNYANAGESYFILVQCFGEQNIPKNGSILHKIIKLCPEPQDQIFLYKEALMLKANIEVGDGDNYSFGVLGLPSSDTLEIAYQWIENEVEFLYVENAQEDEQDGTEEQKTEKTKVPDGNAINKILNDQKMPPKAMKTIKDIMGRIPLDQISHLKPIFKGIIGFNKNQDKAFEKWLDCF